MWNVLRWAAASNERAVANARMGALECSQHRLERAEVELYLSSIATPAVALARVANG